MYVYVLCLTKIDYLEIYEYLEIVGVYKTKKAAELAAKDLEEYTIIRKKVET